MKDLLKHSSLPIKIDGDRLIYDGAIFESVPRPRTYAEAKDVYLEKNAPDQDLYYMYRYLEESNDVKKFEDNKLEYDITLIPDGKVGPEPIKTVGHYHAKVPGTEITYPEVYEVIEGEVIYLLQTMPDAAGNVDVVIVEAKSGDKVVVPPNYGHVSMNVGKNTVVESNIQRADLPASADYDDFKQRNGAALYYTGSDWQENYNYKVNSLKHVRPKMKPEWGLDDRPLYASFLDDPGKFKWLAEPQDYDFSDIWTEK